MRQAWRAKVGALVGIGLLGAGLGVVGPAIPGAAAPATCPGGGAPESRFTDDDASVHESAIACTTWWDLTRGVSPSAFAPARDVTRGQAATLVARLLTRTGADLPASPPDAFPDDTGDAHSFATNRLAALGVVGGRADGRYAPGAGVSRGAMASLLVAAYEARTGMTLPVGGDHFSDDDGTVHEAAIDKAAELGLTQGTIPGRFDPWTQVSRGQAASFLARGLTALDALDQAGTAPLALRAATALEPVDGCDALLGQIKERALETVGPYGLGSFDLPLGVDGDGATDDEQSGGEGGSDGGSPTPTPPDTGSDGSSGTNNQEAGVDEADLVKVRGSLVFAVNGGVLRVIDASGGTPVLRSTLELGLDADHRLLLDGDRLLVLSTGYSVGVPEPLPTDSTDDEGFSVPSPPRTSLRLLDVSDPVEPSLVDAATVDGYVLGARSAGGVARVILHTEPTLGLVGPTGDGPADLAAATATNRERIGASTLADWTPQVRPGLDGDETSTALLGCDDVSTPPEFAGLGMSSVLTVPLAGSLDDPSAVGVLAGSDLIYASPTTLFLTSTRWETWRPGGEGADATRTDLHAFDISDPAGASFLGSGRVAGHLLNQFSLSEHEGVLRVASTTEPLFGDESSPGESRITTLRLAGGALEQVGLLTGLGVEERIFGVRFLGDQGYVVTFRQIDPLHVLDLSDPANPVATGELEMPGYSAYLHPISEDLLLGVGAEADTDGRRTGVQLSLFDVGDPTSPERVSHVTLPDAYTDVEYDHLAFLFWAPAGRAVIPVSEYRFDETTGEVTSDFTGAVGFSVDGSAGLAEVGRTTHADDAPSSADDFGYPGIRRSLVVDGRLLTLSDLGVELASLDDLTELSWLAFAP